jgi:glutamyl/glutaminyl-tRNA synthetase
MVMFLYKVDYDETSWQKVLGHERAPEVLAAAAAVLADLENWDRDSIERALRGMLEHLEIGARRGLQPIRVAVTGSSVSPPLFESLAVLGKREAIRRLHDVHGEL